MRYVKISFKSQTKFILQVEHVGDGHVGNWVGGSIAGCAWTTVKIIPCCSVLYQARLYISLLVTRP